MFKPDSADIKTLIKKTDIPEKNIDSIEWKFIIKDEIGNRQYGTNILLESRNFKNRNIYLPDQELIIRKERSNKIEKIKVLNVGYELLEFDLKMNKSQLIEIIQIPEQPDIVSDSIRYLDIKKRNSNIILEQGSSKYSKS